MKFSANLGFAILLSLIARAEAADAEKHPPAAPPEMAVLAKHVGTWDLEQEVKPGNKWKNNVGKSKLVYVVELTHGGRFIRGDAKGVRLLINGKEVQEQTTYIATYNPQKKAYQSWVFHAMTDATGEGRWNGAEYPTLGRWDEKTRTMTSVQVDTERGITRTETSRWIDDDHMETRNLWTDAEGNVMADQIITATRRKGK